METPRIAFEEAQVLARVRVEHEEDWRGFAGHSPKLQFPPEWQIKILMPWLNAFIRFQAWKGERMVSVAVWRHDPVPADYFWEICPGIDGDDISRFDLDDTAGLLAGIEQALSGGE